MKRSFFYKSGDLIYLTMILHSMHPNQFIVMTANTVM